MLKEKLDTIVREHRLCQKIASTVIYSEAKIVWKKIEDFFQDIVSNNLNERPGQNWHKLEICYLDTDIFYSIDSQNMHYLFFDSIGTSHCVEILNAIFEIAYYEGILVIKKDLPDTRYLTDYMSEYSPIEVEIYEFIYQSPSEK